MSQFFGFVPVGTTLGATIVETSSNVPTDAASLPTYRIYGPAGVMQNGTGSLAFKDTGSVTGTSGSGGLINYHAPAHNLTAGTLVTVSGVTGFSASNATGVVAVVDGDNFTLTGATGTGTGTGGTWHVTGLYGFSYTPTLANGFQQGTTYTVYTTASVGGSTVSEADTFIVV